MDSRTHLSHRLPQRFACTLAFVLAAGFAAPAMGNEIPNLLNDAAGKLPAGATTAYAMASVPISASAGGAPIATLSATSQVKILDTEGDQLKVQVSGWQQGDGRRLIFFAPGRRILVAQLKPEEATRLRRGGSETDPATDQNWTQVSLEGYVPKNRFVTNDDILWKYGDTLMNSNCTSCHPRADLNHFTANQWAGIIRSKKTRVNADAEQLQLLMQYVQKHASDMTKKKQ